MKHHTILAILFISINLSSCDNEIAASQVPSVIENTFKSSFSDASEITWKTINDAYEVSFELDNTDYQAHIDHSGNMLKYKFEIDKNALPPTLYSFLKKAYPEKKWDDAYQIIEGEKKYYQIEVEGVIYEKKLVVDSLGNTLQTTKYWN